MILDFHSHILPAIDDGSRDVAETLKMLSVMAEQGVDCVVATPHFYPDKMRITEFFEKRAKAYALIDQKADLPSVRCGAELAFFRGIGNFDGLEQFCIDGTKLLLIEMPFRGWTKQELNEIENIIHRGFTPILAHVERYYSFQRDFSVFNEILDLPLYLQINAGAFSAFKERRIANKIIEAKGLVLLGSDSHGAEYRAPNLQAGRAALLKKFGEEYLHQMDALGVELLKLKAD